MPFEFPNAPITGDKHTEFGVDYIYDGSVWNLASGGDQTDYVLKAGDVMTGQLRLTGGARFDYQPSVYPTAGEHILYCHNAGYNDPMVGIRYSCPSGTAAALEFWVGDGSTGIASVLKISKPPAINVFAPITTNNGISFGAVTDANADDFAKHIELYSGTNGMGIGTTTGGNFNFVLKNLGHAFNFRMAGATKVQINQYGIMMQENAGLIDFGQNNTNASPSANNKGIRFFYSSGAAYHIGVSNSQFNYVISVGSTRHSFWQGGAERFYIDSTGGHGATLTVEDGFKDKSPKRIAQLRNEYSDLCQVIRPVEGDTDTGEDYDIGELLMLTLAKVKQLEAEIALLKSR